MAIIITKLSAEQVRDSMDDLHLTAPMREDEPRGGWFFGFESAEGNESPLTGPFEWESVARMAAHEVLYGND